MRPVLYIPWKKGYNEEKLQDKEKGDNRWLKKAEED